MSVVTIKGGDRSTPALQGLIPGKTTDQSRTPEFRHRYILTQAELSAIVPGQPANLPGMQGDWIVDVSGSQEIEQGIYSVYITTIATPQGYSLPTYITAQFLPVFSEFLDVADARVLVQTSKPFAAEVWGREVVEFIRDEDVAGINAAEPELPTFRGSPVRNYNAVYTETGNLRGFTTPRQPPQEIIAQRKVDVNWRPGWHRITTIFARYPRL